MCLWLCNGKIRFLLNFCSCPLLCTHVELKPISFLTFAKSAISCLQKYNVSVQGFLLLLFLVPIFLYRQFISLLIRLTAQAYKLCCTWHLRYQERSSIHLLVWSMAAWGVGNERNIWIFELEPWTIQFHTKVVQINWLSRFVCLSVSPYSKAYSSAL